MEKEKREKKTTEQEENFMPYFTGIDNEQKI